MNIDTDALLALPAAEKLELVELLWDNLGDSPQGIPLPGWVDREAIRRRDELISDPGSAMTHEEIWKKING